MTFTPYNNDLPDSYVTPVDVIEELSFYVEGIPASKGSKNPGRGGKGFYEADKKLPAWSKAVTAAAQEALYERPGFGDAPVSITLRFYFKRPPSVTRKHHTVKPDVDKTTRAVLDALTKAKVWDDDCKVTDQHSHKRYADECPPGVRITIRRAA